MSSPDSQGAPPAPLSRGACGCGRKERTMQVFRYEGSWGSSAARTMSIAGAFVGVAIGPESKESRVRVSGGGVSLLVQAGRAYGVRGKSFTIERVDGVAGSFSSV